MITTSYLEGDALLRSILESPNEDTVRLVFADYLDEHGEPERATFIRHQIAEAIHNKQELYGAAMALSQSIPPGEPIRADEGTSAGREYLWALSESRRLQAISVQALREHAAEWLGDLLGKILLPEYGVRPEVVVRTDDWRGWLEFRHAGMSTGPLLKFRRGFVEYVQYHYFYRPEYHSYLKAIFERQPILFVASSRQPDMTVDGQWAWGKWMRTHQFHRLDSRVFRQLRGRGRYGTEQEAIEDFQRACLALGHKLARLHVKPSSCNIPNDNTLQK